MPFNEVVLEEIVEDAMVVGSVSVVGPNDPFAPFSWLPSQGAAGGLLFDTGAVVKHVRSYSAIPDGVVKADGAVASGSPAFTSASAAFTPADVGKVIGIAGAGTAGATLVTTISAFVSATAVTLAANAGTTVSGAARWAYGTDNTTFLQNALNDYRTWAQLQTGWGIYVVTGSLSWPSMAYKRLDGVSEGDPAGQYVAAGVFAPGAVSYILQLTDNIPVIETASPDKLFSTHDCGLNRIGLGFLAYQGAANTNGVAFYFTGQAGSTFFRWHFDHFLTDRAYEGIKVDPACTFWNSGGDWLVFLNTQHTALDINGAAGQPISVFTRVGIFNTNGTSVSDGAAIFGSSAQLAITGLDIEGWYNEIASFASSDAQVTLRDVHIEHHTFNAGNDFLIKALSTLLRIDGISISGSWSNVLATTRLYYAAHLGRILVSRQTSTITITGGGSVVLAVADADATGLWLEAITPDGINVANVSIPAPNDGTFQNRTTLAKLMTQDGSYFYVPTGRSTAQTAAVANLVSVTSPNDGVPHLYRVSGSVTITTLGSGSINLEVNYTDDNGVAHPACIIPLCAEAGTFATSATTADAYKGSLFLLVNPGTGITLKTAGTFTGCTYNTSGVIERLS